MPFCSLIDKSDETALSVIFSDLGLSCTADYELKIKNFEEYSSDFQSLVLKCYRNQYITVITSDNQIAFVNYEMFKNVSESVKSFIESKQPLKINFSLSIINMAINLWYGKDPQNLEGSEIEVYKFAKEFNIESVMNKCIKRSVT